MSKTISMPVAARVDLHRWADNKQGTAKLHKSSAGQGTGDPADKHLYFRGSPRQALLALERWIAERAENAPVETVLRRAEVRFLTAEEVEEIENDDSEVLRWRN